MSRHPDLRVPDLAALHARRSEKWAGHDPDVLVSTIAEMDFPLAAPVKEALRAAIDRDDLGYAPEAIPGLAAAFAGFAQRRMGWRVDPEQVTLVPDVMAGLTGLGRILAGDAAAVAFASPAYPPFFGAPPRAGLHPRPVPLAPGGELDLDALRAELASGTRVLLLANPHNPTGRVLPRTELEAIAELCAEHDAWVLADEIHAPLVLTGASHVPWLEVSDAARERGVSLISASKAFNLAGLKAALLVTASDRARAAVARLPPLGDHAGLLGIVGAEAAFTDGDPWLDAVLAQLDANRSLLGERLAAELPEVAWSPPGGTYLAWLDCRALGLGDDPADAFLRRGRIALGQGPRYGAEGRGFVRVNFGTSPELVAEAVRRMAATV
ncbi:MalY/PatB family protein [Patulibacter sp.]|uniref:MalY/PatB family protein n=1 Tax=Patulibacter sp. TaxID=1912859 RepID=UPI002715C734|nr:aminotransferase class I/II-fold pyridoxal phosphate-dependent enzyme [Patulibacter sp.]MDO9408386.1 aminotransferase class I/II-fold pyridoxal phosphate-dependent enzyme [Patulibacter sp.]